MSFLKINPHPSFLKKQKKKAILTSHYHWFPFTGEFQTTPTPILTTVPSLPPSLPPPLKWTLSCESVNHADYEGLWSYSKRGKKKRATLFYNIAAQRVE